MSALHLLSFYMLAFLFPNNGNFQEIRLLKGQRPGKLNHIKHIRNCDLLGVALYESLGCTPIYRRGRTCPIKFECNLELRNGTCLYGNHYYEIGEYVPRGLVDLCTIGCYCQEDGTFNCALIDCPEWPFPPDPGCYYVNDLLNCCAYGQKCPSNNSETVECHSDGATYYEDQRFIAEGTCNECICNEEFNNGYPECRRIRCSTQIWYQNEVLNNYAPVYFRTNRCCPATWIQNYGQEIINLSGNRGKKSPDLQCQFGNSTVDYGYGFRTTIFSTEVTCKCELPPFLTCAL